jgi:hypothetical protein
MNSGMQELEQMYLAEQKEKHRHFPESYFLKLKYDTTTANGLTRAIVKWFDLKRGYATRVNTGGVYDEKLGKYRLGSSKRGFSDIQAVYKGYAIYVEVKIKRDIQSEYQKEFQNQITACGGYYYVAKDFQSFVDWFYKVIEKKGSKAL